MLRVWRGLDAEGGVLVPEVSRPFQVQLLRSGGNLTPRRRFDIPFDCTAELSPKGYQFFTDIFETFDKARPLSPLLPSRSFLFPLCPFATTR